MRGKISLYLILLQTLLFGGGSHQLVKVLQFTTYGDNQYILVVKPINKNKENNYVDPYIGKCSLFSVIGRYEPLSLFDSGHIPSKEDFDKAINYLNSKPSQIYLGWMGSGFNQLNKNEPCVVESRSLELKKDYSGKLSVWSYFIGT